MKLPCIFTSLLLAAALTLTSGATETAVINPSCIVSVEALGTNIGFIQPPKKVFLDNERPVWQLIAETIGEEKLNGGESIESGVFSVKIPRGNAFVSDKLTAILGEADDFNGDTLSNGVFYPETARFVVILNYEVVATTLSDVVAEPGDVIRLCYSLTGDGSDYYYGVGTAPLFQSAVNRVYAYREFAANPLAVLKATLERPDLTEDEWQAALSAERTTKDEKAAKPLGGIMPYILIGGGVAMIATSLHISRKNRARARQQGKNV
ncbi:MAG: hypothetical protein LBN40_02340 [Oscillospiraceae bacterium]|jgi:hypothetical protein|nr:hypothetical protein [Oscillospiraceae bacterium]